jgi:glycosyltransferase involved in cell wall biosynthesis
VYWATENRPGKAMSFEHPSTTSKSAANRPHVAINAHLLSCRAGYRSAGIHWYVHHLLRHLGRSAGGPRFTVLLGEGLLPPDTPHSLLRSRWPTGSAPARIAWEQLVQPWTLQRLAVDLVHAPAFVGPLLAPCPAVITIHDLSFYLFPSLFRPANRLYLATMTRASVRRARRLIAVSAHTAAETVRLLGVPESKIDVVYHGIEDRYHPLPAKEVAAFRKRAGLPEQFVLFVGTLEPRKNLVRLVEAFARARRGAPGAGVALVLAGGKGWLYDEVFARAEALGLREAVLFPGYLAQETLPLWYNAATVVAYPSLYEGFGLPVLEAQACGTPVLTATTTSLPEAAGDAALMVNPRNVEEMAEGLSRLLADRPLRDELRERGLAHAGQFTWRRTAQDTVRTYRRALAEGGNT